ncbi:DUF2680 domain-containing protein [Anaeroselena agilis]|uniref:DUF2680 domain-containing protein n=1 Tax=Anaeroselena agilis TaxID=3063788 RepID=A0ABU3NX88_9FIRM|nr:DUF2680 domain-containing protein [Selenomonadales bacterium 4137-cl]
MKKTSLFVAVVLVVVSFSGLVVAAPAQDPAQSGGNWYCPNYGQNYNNLTDDQKAQIAAWQQQSLDQRKQVLQKQVEWGWITQSQADQQISWMQQHIADSAYGHGPMGMMGGYGMSGGHGMGHGGGGGRW